MIFALTLFALIGLAFGEGHPYSFGYTSLDAGRHSRVESGAGGAVTGSYSYIDANGHQRQVNYVADALGYRATGDVGVDRVTAANAAAVASYAPQASQSIQAAALLNSSPASTILAPATAVAAAPAVATTARISYSAPLNAAHFSNAGYAVPAFAHAAYAAPAFAHAAYAADPALASYSVQTAIPGATTLIQSNAGVLGNIALHQAPLLRTHQIAAAPLRTAYTVATPTHTIQAW